MSDSTATTLKKVHTPVTRRLTRAQVLIFGSAAFFSIYIFEFATRNYNNPLLAGLSIAGLVFIWLFVFICARSERTLYKSSVFIDFVFKFITGEDRVSKYGPNTRDSDFERQIKAEKMGPDGIVKFSKCKTYDRNSCNRGFVVIANPSDVQDLESFNVNLGSMLLSLKPGYEHKTIAVQSKDMGKLSEQYEKELENSNLSQHRRAALYSLKQFFDNQRGRVGWLFITFVGIGYIVDDELAKTTMDETSESYMRFLWGAGVQSRIVTDKDDYVLIYKQLFSMKNLGGIV